VRWARSLKARVIALGHGLYRRGRAASLHLFKRGREIVQYGKSRVRGLWNGVLRWLSVRRGGGPGWLSWEVREAISHQSAERPPPNSIRLARVLRTPSRRALVALAVLYIATLPISWLLSSWDPEVAGLPSEIGSLYETMWQVQAAIAAFALPLLLFVIELSRDERQAATRTPEVLIRESAALSVIAFSLLGTVRIGVDIAWFQVESVFVIDFVLVFLTTIVLALVAYLLVLTTILSPTRLRRKSLEVLRERLRRNVRHSLEVRVGTNILIARLSNMGADYWPWPPRGQELKDYAVVRADRAGYLTDVHLDELARFIDRLPWAPPTSTVALAQRPTLASSSPGPTEPAVWFLKRYGDQVTDDSNGLLRLQRNAFTDLDENVLSRGLSRIVKIRSTDEP
jgi:hypothetical protein